MTSNRIARWAPMAAAVPNTDRSTRADQAFAILQRIASPNAEGPSDEVIDSIARATESTPQSVRSWFGSLSRAPMLSAVIEAPDETYQAARIAWRMAWQAAWPLGRTEKSRLRVRRRLDGFLASLIVTQMAAASSGLHSR
jgi:hypothetical protein